MNKNLTTFYQPIFDLKRRRTIAVESLARIRENKTYKTAMPLIQQYKTENQLNQLNQLLLEKAVRNFKKIGYLKNAYLSVNYDLSQIEMPDQLADKFISTVKQYNFDPSKIILEVVESNIYDQGALLFFLKKIKSSGIMVALDDLGSESSNFNRISLIKPNILKIDRDLLKGISDDVTRQEMVRSVVNISNRMGAIVIAEGVETKAEFLTSLDLRLNFFQGFYFCKPNSKFTRGEMNIIFKRIETTFKSHYLKRINRKKVRSDQYRKTTESIKGKITNASKKKTMEILSSLVKTTPNMDCVFILSKEGMQMSRSFTKYEKQRKKNELFSPAIKDADHSNKPYFIEISRMNSYYLSEPYISMATGVLCQTSVIGFSYTSKKIDAYLCVDYLKK